VKWMCERLEVSRSGFYAWTARRESARAQRDERLGRLVEEHFEQSSGTYGSPRIHALLGRQGERCARKRVARARPQGPGKPHLSALAGQRRLQAGPGQPGARALRHRTQPGLAGRHHVSQGGWQLALPRCGHRPVFTPPGGLEDGTAAHHRSHGRCDAPGDQRRRPPAGLIFHSDRGSEYGGYDFRDRLARGGIVQSMNRPKTMTDNAHMESFFHSMKSDVIHGHAQRKPAELELVVRRYIAHYNRTRLHSALAYRSPIDYERANA
jgi:putative transposase